MIGTAALWLAEYMLWEGGGDSTRSREVLLEFVSVSLEQTVEESGALRRVTFRSTYLPALSIARTKVNLRSLLKFRMQYLKEQPFSSFSAPRVFMRNSTRREEIHPPDAVK